MNNEHITFDKDTMAASPGLTIDKSLDSQSDFVTLLRLKSRANKLVKRDASGDLSKEAGPPIISATASTVYVPDAPSMKALLLEVADNPNTVIIPSGYFPCSEPDSNEPLAAGSKFNISSKAFLAGHLGTEKDDTDRLAGWHQIDGQRHIARLKANMLPSSWVLFNRDEVQGMPEHLAVMSDDEWLAAMGEMIPGLGDVEKVMVPSSTGRVLVDGKPMAASGQHYYVQIDDVGDLERFGATLLQRSFLTGRGFMRPLYSKPQQDKVVIARQWSIFDPTTFSHERLAYEGAPTLKGEGLTLAPPRVEVIRP